jgi:hypothetical protein
MTGIEPIYRNVVRDFKPQFCLAQKDRNFNMLIMWEILTAILGIFGEID